MKKKIKILYRGPIYEKGSIYGPITTPYLEDVRTISRLLLSGKKVVEVLDGGIELELDLNNFNIDNSTPQPVEEVVTEVKTESTCNESGCSVEEVCSPGDIEVTEEPVEVCVPVKPEPVCEETLTEVIVDSVSEEDESSEEESNDSNESDINNDNHFRRMKKKKNR